MQSNSDICRSTQILLTKLQLFLESVQIPFDQFFNNFQTINMKQLSKLEFFRVINLLHIQSLQNFTPFEAFKDLAGNSETLVISELKNRYEKNKYAEKKPKQEIDKNKTKEEEMKKKLARISVYKLQEYLKKCESPMQLLTEIDLDGNKSISKLQFNSFLIATGIKELNNKQIRRILIDDIFKSFKPKNEISFEQFMTLFKIPHQKLNVYPEPIKLKKEDYFQIKKEDNKHNFNKQKQPEQSPNSSNNAQKFLIIPKHNQAPIYEPQDKSVQNYFQQGNRMFPNAIKYYRLGQPMPSEHQFLQELDTLLKTKNKFQDRENPLTKEGVYLQSASIFTGKFHIFQMASSVLMRQVSRMGIARQIQPKDIIQGEVGDCYFLSSIASIISIYPELISQRFLFEVNDSSYYAVKLFVDGQWKVVKTDDRFPCQNGRPIYAKPHTNQIWVLLLEKCWAKLFGSYKAIESGSSTEGFLALSGAPSEIFSVDKEKNENQLVKQLENVFKRRYVATMSGSKQLESLSSNARQKIGLISGHAYSFLKLIKIGDQALIKMRNPWGKTIWSGDWSFQSSKWTPQLRKKYNYMRNPEDGSFYLPWQQFIKYFSEVVICKLNPTYVHESLRIHSTKRKSAYLAMKVKQSGQYIISIYQESKRKFRDYKNYQFAQTRLIILRKDSQKEEYIYVGSKAVNQALCCNVQLQLQQGVYIISAKVFWKFWPDHDFVLTSYGPERVKFQNINRQIAPQFKSSMIKSYVSQFKGTGKLKTYEKYGLQATCETNFSMETGIGYVRMTGQGGKAFKSIYTIKLTGLKVIKPDKIPYTFNVASGSEHIIGLFVSPGGYEYSSSEAITY